MGLRGVKIVFVKKRILNFMCGVLFKKIRFDYECAFKLFYFFIWIMIRSK